MQHFRKNFGAFKNVCDLDGKHSKLSQKALKKGENPGQTVRADIRLDIRKIKDIRVELSIQPRISVLNRAPISVAPISARISAWISVLRISEREFYCGYPWLYG